MLFSRNSFVAVHSDLIDDKQNKGKQIAIRRILQNFEKFRLGLTGNPEYRKQSHS